MTHIVFPDICTIRHATGGSLCPDVQCRRTDAGRRGCGSKNCENGLLNNGYGSFAPGDETFLLDVHANPAGCGVDDERNHSLAAVARMVSQADKGLISIGSSEYHTIELSRQLVAEFGKEEAEDTITVLRALTATSFGQNISAAAAKVMEKQWTSLLSDVHHKALFDDRADGKPLIDHEDAMFVAAMLLTGQPVTIVTNDFRFIEAGRVLARYFREFYVVSTETYANPSKYVQAQMDLDKMHASGTLVAA